MAFGWDDAAIYGAILGLDFIYHRYLNPPPSPKPPTYEVKVPITDVGAPFPLIYGMCRVRKPVLAWNSIPIAYQTNDAPSFNGVPIFPAGTFLYAMSMFFVLGTPFATTGWPTFGVYNHVHSFYVSDQKLAAGTSGGIFGGAASLGALTGGGGYELPCGVGSPQIDATGTPTSSHGVYMNGAIEFLNGNPDQLLVASTVPYGSGTYAGNQMSVAGHPERIPGYRGLMGVFLFSLDSNSKIRVGPNTLDAAWVAGATAQLDGYSFEASSYPPVPLAAQRMIGSDANPIDVLYDLLTGTRGKLGLSTSLIDTVSFAAAATTLAAEAHGYSRAIEDGQTAEASIAEILIQIDGVLFFDPTANLIKIKLVRADYDPAAVVEISPDNCEALQSVSIAGWTGLPNRIRVTYTSRSNSYIDDMVTAQNHANAIGQDGAVNEIQLSFPGVCTSTLAMAIAQRELAARSRPITKLTAKVDRTFLASNPGDVVAVSWPQYGWSRILFRVATVGRGTLADGTVTLGLIQEYFQVYRGSPRSGPITTSFPHSSGTTVG